MRMCTVNSPTTALLRNAGSSCCCRAEHLHLPCPVADCPDYVPRGRDDFVPVLTSKQLAERQAAQAAITPPAQQTTLAEIRARLDAAKAAWDKRR